MKVFLFFSFFPFFLFFLFFFPFFLNFFHFQPTKEPVDYCRPPWKCQRQLSFSYTRPYHRSQPEILKSKQMIVCFFVNKYDLCVNPNNTCSLLPSSKVIHPHVKELWPNQFSITSSWDICGKLFYEIPSPVVLCHLLANSWKSVLLFSSWYYSRHWQPTWRAPQRRRALNFPLNFFFFFHQQQLLTKSSLLHL